jgi:hypothetical protein
MCHGTDDPVHDLANLIHILPSHHLLGGIIYGLLDDLRLHLYREGEVEEQPGSPTVTWDDGQRREVEISGGGHP